MKQSKLMLLAGAASAALIGVQTSQAQQFCPVSVTLNVTSPNATTHLVSQTFGNGEIIRQAASDNGLTSLAGLHLVYDQYANAIEVASGTNDAIISTAMVFSANTLMTNYNSTRVVGLSSVYWGGSYTVNGSMVTDETYVLPHNSFPGSFALTGHFQLSVPASGTNVAAVITGEIATSGKAYTLSY